MAPSKCDMHTPEFLLTALSSSPHLTAIISLMRAVKPAAQSHCFVRINLICPRFYIALKVDLTVRGKCIPLLIRSSCSGHPGAVRTPAVRRGGRGYKIGASISACNLIVLSAKCLLNSLTLLSILDLDKKLERPYLLNTLSVTLVLAAVLLQFTHDFLPRYRREHLRDPLPRRIT